MIETDNPWTTLKSKDVYQNPWIKLIEHDIINPAGNPGVYGQVHFKNKAIGVVVLDDENYTWLVGQHRFPLNLYSWEIPEGGGPLGTDPLDSAKRELLEETGIIANKWTKIQEMHLSNSVTDEHSIVYLAQDLTFGEAEPEETEQLQVKRLPFEEVYQMVINGTITDSVSVAAIFKVKLMLEGLC